MGMLISEVFFAWFVYFAVEFPFPRLFLLCVFAPLRLCVKYRRANYRSAYSRFRIRPHLHRRPHRIPPFPQSKFCSAIARGSITAVVLPVLTR